jgi:hypothetical protein
MGFLLSLPCDVAALKNAFALCSPTALRRVQIGCFGQAHRKANEAEKARGGGVCLLLSLLIALADRQSVNPSMLSFPQMLPANYRRFFTEI